MVRSYRIWTYPNAAQARLIDRYLGAARWLWNTVLEIRSEFYQVFKQGSTGVDRSQWPTQGKLPKFGRLKLIEAIPPVSQ